MDSIEANENKGSSPTENRSVALRREMELMTESDLADMVNVDVAAVRAWRSQSKGPPWTRLGRGVFYRRQDVRDWIASKVERPENEAPVAASA